MAEWTIETVADRFIEAAMKDKELASIMWHVRMLISPPTDMFAPSVLWKVGSNFVKSNVLGFEGKRVVSLST